MGKNIQKEKILFSWLSPRTDFSLNRETKEKTVNPDGPTFEFHREFFTKENYTKHILLTTASNEDKEVRYFVERLDYIYPKRVEVRYMDIDGKEDPTDLQLIKTKVETILLEPQFKKDNKRELHFWFSPGNSVMQLVWFLMHHGLDLNTTCIKTVERSRTELVGKPGISTVDFDKSQTLLSIIIKSNKDEKREDNFYFAEVLKPIYDLALKAAQAPSKVSVLIRGDTGTGKENLAKYIHNESPRRDLEMQIVNCAELNENLLGSTLFGHKKGAYTDAKEDREGVFKTANGSTLFLDEIGDISPKIQQSLLRVLQSKKIQPLGSDELIEVDVRIIAATNRDLVQMCREGDFRLDLYYRLTGVQLNLPRFIRWSDADKKGLIKQMVKENKKLFNKDLTINKEVIQKLLDHTFPGNIRELQNIIDRFFVYYNDIVTLKELPVDISLPLVSNPQTLDDVEKNHIIKMSSELNFFSAEGIAKVLGKKRNTYLKKVIDYGLFEEFSARGGWDINPDTIVPDYSERKNKEKGDEGKER